MKVDPITPLWLDFDYNVVICPTQDNTIPLADEVAKT